MTTKTVKPPTPAQKAILPLNEARLTAGYKTKGYTAYMAAAYNMKNVVHYGIDLTDDDRKDKELIAPFDMKIVYAGFDTLMGNTVIAVSTRKVDIHSGPGKGAQVIAIRIAHMASVSVKAGDVVKQKTIIGKYGHTGRYGGSDHAHIEIDLDQTAPNFTPTLAGTSNIWKHGSDTTINPMDVFKVGKDQKFYATYWEGGMDEDDYITFTTSGKEIKAIKKA